ncbi:MAG: phosphoribosylaminoimidazolesuccinocarboxamide synthase [Halothiobacillaceae bacterium]
MTSALFDSHIPNLPLIHRGKVRDIYGVDGKHLLIVTTDRLSAFDVILPTPIPGKGEVLTQTALFWFKRFEKLIPNHLATDLTLEDVIPDAQLRAMLAPRTMLVKKLKALPIEAIARGYLIGSGWKDYQATGKVCGIPLPAGLRLADKLPEPIYTPSSKAAVGEHDENIDFDTTVRLVGPKLAEQVRDMTLRIYKEAADYALQRGIIIADTKFEFGVDEHGTLHLIDEVLTPDSSRFWPLDTYAPGKSPESFDKQFVRDWLETLDWDKTPPGPELPAEIVERTASKYREALQRLTA